MATKRILKIFPSLFPLILLSLVACAPQGAVNSESPTKQKPLPTIDFSDYKTPTLVPVTPQGEVQEIGLNIRGWT